MPRLNDSLGERTVVYWNIQHYNDPATTTKGYEGWRDSNHDCFPKEAYSLSCQCWQKTGHHGFLTEEIGKQALEILRTKEFLQQTGPYERKTKLAFDGKPLRLVKVVQYLSIQLVEETPKTKKVHKPKRRPPKEEGQLVVCG